MSHETLTPPEVAKRWRIKPDRVIALIRRGELRAFDISQNPGVGRPRYRVTIEAVRDFEEQRSAAQPKPKRRQRQRDSDIISFIR